MDNHKKKPSLIDRKAKGGVDARKGFTFQDHYVVSNIPFWLSNPSFAKVKQEVVEDIELTFFDAKQGLVKRLAQAKNTKLEQRDFKEIIEQFHQLSFSAKFDRFYIVVQNISDGITSVVNAIQHLQRHYKDYKGTEIGNTSIDEYFDLAEKANIDGELADFVLNTVEIKVAPELSNQDTFRTNIEEYFPEFKKRFGSEVEVIHHQIQSLVQATNCNISRRQLEEILFINSDVPTPPISLNISTLQQDTPSETGLNIDLSSNYIGVEKIPNSAASWDTSALNQLSETKIWINQNTYSRSILVHKQRLSASIAIGHIFSSRSEFDLQMEHNGVIWRTDNHPDPSTPHYDYDVDFTNGNSRLVVVVGIMRDIVNNVSKELHQFRLSDASILGFYGESALVSDQQLNQLSQNIKNDINAALTQIDGYELHLFLAGPSHLAMFLGHFLNAKVPLQLYEWVEGRKYIPTFRLTEDGN